ncbi:hypothetical protein FOE78_00145 [Microlunatus elymi]|uniref:HicB family protein n=1 Tax=Microlunatus elymi TaxID=2596828 RepID=A0A516PTM1_9ACTN|nr:hypothetical protein [Microlunatus elymi]QDP94535.1 hypothetical protein FOE78_00145 [Microlunatus elymi]
MDISKHVDTVRSGIVDAAALADENTQEVARRLGTAVGSSARLALLDAISDATTEISAELAPGSVELRVVDGNPNFTVHVPQSAEPTLILPDQPAAQQQEREAEPEAEITDEPDEDEPMVRVSLRLPASVKNKVDEAADSEGISTNAWLVRAIQNALVPIPPTPPTPPSGSSIPGVNEVFGPNGPLGPQGIFGPEGIFGPGGVFGGEQSRPGHQRRGRNVKGWVK